MADRSVTSLLKWVVDIPQPKEKWALFLDLDGTLLDIAESPHDVHVPPTLIKHLSTAHDALNGALAIVSGRPLPEIDNLLAPLRLPSAGEHGAVMRLPDGSYDEVTVKLPLEWLSTLADAVSRMPGVWVERKTYCTTVHYRRMPKHEEALRCIIHDLVARSPSVYEMLEAKMAFEIRPRIVNKGRAVQLFMSRPPFRGRIPVFIGDDVTDRDGFAGAEALGGYAFDVQHHFGGRPQQVRSWLRTAFDDAA